VFCRGIDSSQALVANLAILFLEYNLDCFFSFSVLVHNRRDIGPGADHFFGLIVS
jgi:hypothetical protein